MMQVELLPVQLSSSRVVPNVSCDPGSLHINLICAMTSGMWNIGHILFAVMIAKNINSTKERDE